MTTSVAVIAGGAGGIGRAIASMLAERYRVGILDLDERGARDCAAALRDAFAISVDLRDPAQVDRAFSQARTQGEISVLVNTAGYGGPFLEVTDLSLEQWRTTIDANLTAPFLAIQAVLPQMRRSRAGRIVNVASVQGLVGARLSAAYVASKHGLVGLTRTVAAEVARDGITCNAVCPGYVETRMGVQEEAVAGHGTAVLRRTPAGRLARPEEVASLVAYLASAEASFINGAVLTVDGGMLADLGVT